MQASTVWRVWIPVAAVALVVLPTRGQEAPPVLGTPVTQPPAGGAEAAPEPADLPFQVQQIHRSARGGIDWLLRVNRPDGRFLYGYIPSLRAAVENDNYLHQTAATFALARAARLFQNDRAAAVARQAVLTLLLETATDPGNPAVRRTAYPSAALNRLASAGWLVLAINELPAPGGDLLRQSEELCNYIRAQQLPDGSFRLSDDPNDTRPPAADPAAVADCTGPALYGLMRSLRHQKGDWKLDVARKARDYYRAYWRSDHKNMALVSLHTAAYAEAYLLTREQSFADCVNEMNDWVCTLQYNNPDPRRALWFGGFQGWADGQPRLAPPGVESAAYLEGLGQACRVARVTGDLPRFETYSQTMERCGLFLTTLQYTGATTQHFIPEERARILGAFHPSHQDGRIQIDYTQQAVCAMMKYLEDVAQWKAQD